MLSGIFVILCQNSHGQRFKEKRIPFEVAVESNRQESPREAMFGCLRGEYKIADDFDAPLEDFKEYM